MTTYTYNVLSPDGKSVSRNLHERFPGIRKDEFRSVYVRARFKKGGPLEDRTFHGILMTFGTVNCRVKIPHETHPGRFRYFTVQSHHIIDII